MKNSKNLHKYYTNGMVIAAGHHKEAKTAATAAGIYQSLGNFGPYHRAKLPTGVNNKPVRVVRTGLWEIFMYEIQCSNFSFGAGLLPQLSPLCKEIWGFYQPVRKSNKTSNRLAASDQLHN
jgi:hypothetical protein